MSTSAKPKKLPKRDIRGPFAPRVKARAREIASHYQIIIWSESGEYYGQGLELPTTYGDGRTPDECVANVREALEATVAYLLEKGRIPPTPAMLSDAGRTEEINVRVSAEEKIRLEGLARARGFRGVADYVRSRALT